jgi:hypothetical protein
MTDQIHADHEVDRQAIGPDELARAHRTGHEVRRLLAIERRDDDTTTVVLVCEGTRHLDEDRDRSRVVIGAPEHLTAVRPEMIEVRADQHVPSDVAVNHREHVGAAAGIDALFARIEPRISQRGHHHSARSIAAGGAGATARTYRTAKVFDETPHGLTP